MSTVTYLCSFLRARFAPLSPQLFGWGPSFASHIYHFFVEIACPLLASPSGEAGGFNLFSQFGQSYQQTADSQQLSAMILIENLCFLPAARCKLPAESPVSPQIRSALGALRRGKHSLLPQ